MPISLFMRHSPLDSRDFESDLLVAQTRSRRAFSLGGRERSSRWAAALLLLVGAGLLAYFGNTTLSLSVPEFLVLLGLYAVASQIELEVASGSAIPTQLVFVPMLFFIPAASLPLVVALGFVLGALPDYVRRRAHPERAAALIGSSWYAFGPALFLLAVGEPSATIDSWPYVVAAVGAQILIEAVSTAIREWSAIGVTPRQLVRPLLAVFTVDILLTPVGFAAAVATGNALGVLLCAPLLVLIWIFARDREAHIDSTLELSHAYRGTALLLGDVIEAGDAYTGSHSQDVVELSLAVSDQLGLPAEERRKVELTALLHDVGKIRVPQSIIQKPGLLDDAEWEIMRHHTIEGEQLLRRVGGLLEEVGTIVRSCHEHFDGTGYPDGLAGEKIPHAARIVTACDAFNAMTTNRSYRKALTYHEAISELRRCAGTQFDPQIVDALITSTAESPA